MRAIILGLALLTAASAGCGGGDPGFVWEEWPAPLLSDVPRPEQPDPAFARRDWISMNGGWEFRLDPDDRGVADGWADPTTTYDRRIVVPFPWTSRLSGVNVDTGDGGGIGWYRRSFALPASFSGRPVELVVGAADWYLSLWVNGRLALHEAESGFLPVRSDITPFLVEGENSIVIRVRDVGNDARHPHGKQGTPWYANVGGIWQSVTLEAVAPTRLTSVRLTPDLDRKTFSVSGTLGGEQAAGNCRLTVWAKGRDEGPVLDAPVSGPEFSGGIAVPWLDPWSPENPVVQEFELRLACGSGRDTVRTHAGLRSVSRSRLPGLDHEAVHLNGTPVYLRGVLVQGYHPDGLYTYPSEQTMIDDLEAARRFGFNLVRLHIKTEEPRLLYHADRLGLLVDYDVPCHGIFPFESGDGPEARTRWQALMEGMIRRDFNHPSIVWWTLFNEDWGLTGLVDGYDAGRQAFVASMLARAKQIDPSRLIEDHSTLRYDHISGTDINSFHLYDDDPASFDRQLAEWSDGCYPGSEHNFVPGHRQDGAPLVNTEYGPFSAEYGVPQWRRDRDISWGFRELTGALRGRERLAGYVFTELYDVEFERNGWLRYDRTPKESGYPFAEGPAALQGADFVGFREPSFQVAAGTPSIVVRPFVSAFGAAADGTDGGELSIGLYAAADVRLWETTVLVAARPYRVTDLPPVEVELPAGLEGGAYLLAVWSRGGAVLAKNVLPGEVIAPARPLSECGEGQCTVTLSLEECFGDLDPATAVEVDGETMAAGTLGGGRLVCPVPIPTWIPADRLVSVGFEAEMAANREGAPQTADDRSTGSHVSISLDGWPLDRLTLPPDRADSRGILSHLNGSTPRGGYGDMLQSAVRPQFPLKTGDYAALTLDPDDGVIVYGRRLGRYGRQPTVRFSWE